MPNNKRKSLKKLFPSASNKAVGKKQQKPNGEEAGAEAATRGVAKKSIQTSAKSLTWQEGMAGSHPASRKVTQLNRCMERQKRIKQIHDQASLVKNTLVEKYVWFQSILPLDQPCCTLDTLREYIHRYNHRHSFFIKELEDKVAQELIDRKKQTKSTRHNRTLSGDAQKLQALQRLVHDAEQQFKQGLVVPDLTQPKNVETLRSWRGDPNAMDRIKTIVVKEARPAPSEDMQS